MKNPLLDKVAQSVLADFYASRRDGITYGGETLNPDEARKRARYGVMTRYTHICLVGQKYICKYI